MSGTGDHSGSGRRHNQARNRAANPPDCLKRHQIVNVTSHDKRHYGYGAGPRSEAFLRAPPGTVSHPTASTRSNPTSQKATR